MRIHVHHVAYKVYATNDARELIALCPSCHDAVHNGELGLDDATLYRWKQLQRPAGRQAHIYVEPGESSKLLLGTVALTGSSGAIAFELSETNQLSFNLEGSSRIVLLDLNVSSAVGVQLVRVEKGYVHVLSDDVDFRCRPGRVSLTAPLGDDYFPRWALDRLRVQEPSYGNDGRCTILDLEVLEPGLVRVQGVWVQNERVVAITMQRLAFIWPALVQPLSMCGEGAASTLMYAGPINAAVFGFSDGPPAALAIPTST